MNVNSTDVIQKKYILLDWNVIKYLKKPRNSSDEEFCNLLTQIRKRYEIPFCEAHLRDLSRSYTESNKNLVKEDLIFLQNLSQSVVIGIDDEVDNVFHLIRGYDPSKLFHELISENEAKPNITSEMNPQEIFKVDMQKLDQEHPMRSMLKKTDGLWGPGIMANWMNSMYETIFNEVDDYKKMREYIKKIKQDLEENENSLSENELIYKNYLEKHMMPFINSLEIENYDELAELWENIIINWLQMSYGENIPFGALITTAYVMLDYHPLFKEKLKKRKNTLSNIARDSKMIYYASFSKYFVTEDKVCLEKTKFIFKALQCSAKAMNMEEFIRIFS